MATYNSNVYAAGNPAKYGVYPSWVIGYVTIGTGVTLTTSDTINLCLIPANTSLIGQFVISVPDLDDDGTPAITLSLKDNSSSTSGGVLPAGTTAQTSPITYVSASTTGQSAGNITGASLAAGVLGTTYASQQILQLIPAHAATGVSATNATIYFMFGFQPL